MIVVNRAREHETKPVGAAANRGKAWLLLLLSLGLAAGCSGGSSKAGAGCQSMCKDVCDALHSCDAIAPDPNCVSQCVAGSNSSDCSNARPASQLTCSELQQVYDCANYCATVCTRAPSCGAFDATLCAAGCAMEQPAICNSASVAARTCDQLKPELRAYEDTARESQDGKGAIFGHASGSSGAAYGLCSTAEDCTAPLGCSQASNTCGACSTDADCKREFPRQACSPAHECVKVDCLADADCLSNEFCNVARHTCGECHVDADCTFVYKACNTTTEKCVACVTDAQCLPDVAPICDVTKNSCVGCLSNADCKEPAAPTCNPKLGFCTAQ